MTFGTCQPTPGPLVFALMKTPTTGQQLLRARRYLVLLGLASVLGLEAFVYFDLHHRSSLEMPVFLTIFCILIALGAAISNAMRCPKCAIHLRPRYIDGVGGDLHFCPGCGTDFDAPLPPLGH